VKTNSLIATALISLASLLSSRAAVDVAGTMLYQQNFDGLPTAASITQFNWQDDVTVPGFYFHRSNTPAGQTSLAGTLSVEGARPFVADGSLAPNGTPNHHGLVSLGFFGDTERALGTCPTTNDGGANWSGGTLSILAVFTNTGAKSVDLTNVTYDLENWRSNDNTTIAETISLTYKTGTAAALLAELGNNATGANFGIAGYNPVAGGIFDFTSFDGFLSPPPPGTTQRTGAVDPPIRISPGQSVVLRWGNVNDGGVDALVGIDNLAINFVEVDASVVPVVSNVVRSNNGTPANPADDTVSFDLTVTGLGTVNPAGWTISSAPLAGTTGTYGVAKAITGVSIAAFDPFSRQLNVVVEDQGNATVNATVAVTAPWSSLTPAVSNVTRDSLGTPLDPFDDTWGYTVTVTGQFTGPGFTSDNAGIASPGTYGTPYTISGLPIFLPSETTNFFDSADPAVSAFITVSAPRIIGTVNFGTASPLFTDNDGVPANWLVDESLLTQSMNNGGGAPAKLYRSQVIDLTTVGAVRFNASITVTDTSSGFEADDTLDAKLIIDGDTLNPVSLITAYDTLQPPNGIMNGAELSPANPGPPPTSGAGTFVHPLSAIIPPAANSVQLVISGNNNSTNETMTLQNIVFDLAPPSIVATGPTDVVRVENGPGLADDTVTFNATLTGINAGPGWTTATPGVTPASGAYGTVAFTLAAPLPASPLTITFQDSTNAAITGILNVNIPSRAIIGQRDFGGGAVDVAVSLAAPQSGLWLNDPGLRTLTINAGVNAQTETVTSEVLDLSAVGAVRVTAKLLASDTSTGSNFDQPDKFKAELIIDGGLPTESVVNLVSSYDTGDGATAVPFAEGQPLPNGPPDGWINGYTGTASAVDGFAAGLDEYDAHRARDEFNRNGQTGAEFPSVEFPLTHVIPAAANSVQLRIQSQGIQGTENAVFQELLFALDTAPPPIVPGNASMALNNGAAGKLSAASVVALATGGSGPLSISAVQAGPTGRGSTAGLQEGWLVYDPAAAITGADSFTYSITDGSQTVTGTVTVAMSAPAGEALHIAGIVPEGAGNRVVGMGIPGRTYGWQFSSDLQVWTPLGPPVVCPANGVLSVVDPGPLPPTRFYRLLESVTP